MIEWMLPLRLVSEGNLREHWTKKHKRHREQLLLVKFAAQTNPKPTLPCSVTITRISPRSLDDDNMAFSCKSLRDYIADALLPGLQMGRADNDKRISWIYKQEKGKPQRVKIQFENV